MVETHTEMGESIRPWVLAMFVALLGVEVGGGEGGERGERDD